MDSIEDDIAVINDVFGFIDFLHLIAKRKTTESTTIKQEEVSSILLDDSRIVTGQTLSWKKYESMSKDQREKCILAAIQRLRQE